MILNYNHLIDAKINSIYFKFDAMKYMTSQNLEVSIQNLIDELVHYNLIFLNVSSFCFNIKTGSMSINTNHYEADCLYIKELKNINSSNNHQHWVIYLIDDIGTIEIFCDDFLIQDA